MPTTEIKHTEHHQQTFTEAPNSVGIGGTGAQDQTVEMNNCTRVSAQEKSKGTLRSEGQNTEVHGLVGEVENVADTLLPKTASEQDQVSKDTPPGPVQDLEEGILPDKAHQKGTAGHEAKWCSDDGGTQPGSRAWLYGGIVGLCLAGGLVAVMLARK